MTTSALHGLAGELGVATEYWDWQGRRVEVSESTLVAVLTSLGVDASDPEAALAARDRGRWSRMLPPVMVVREGRAGSVDVHVPHGASVDVWLEPEGGGSPIRLRQLENWSEPRTLDGTLTGEATFEVPSSVPLGYHEVRARCGDVGSAMLLAVAPGVLDLPERIQDRGAWGLATQLYSVRSADSWGVGDLTDLADLSVWSAAEHGAGFVLVNPMHAAAPTAPMEPSPYLPTTRRFTNPLYLRIERVPEYARLGWRERWEVDGVRTRLQASLGGLDLVDRDTAWAAKRQALEALFEVPRTAGRELAFRAYCRREGRSLEDFATWCAIAESSGGDWREWPAELRDPRSRSVTEFAASHGELVDFHRWLQWLMDEQLAEAQSAARRAGMTIGVMHDLAVGVSLSGAESWALQDVFAQGVTVGAPPDAYNQAGQDWSQPPWRPDRLAEARYSPFREMVASTLRQAGGIRVDHIVGLFRLWWIPSQGSPMEGTYVRYDHEALVGILALEAHRAAAVVVGEDVGTVEPWARTYLRERGILGTSILWFELDYDGDRDPLPPERWRDLCLASVTTHDLPPTAGYLAGDHLAIREELGLLTRPAADERAELKRSVEAWLDLLRRRGLLTDDGGTDEAVVALHRFLRQTPARLLCVSLADAVGDRRMQNQPGTVDAYPNWRVPLAGSDGRPILLEDVFGDERARVLLSTFAE